MVESTFSFTCLRSYLRRIVNKLLCIKHCSAVSQNIDQTLKLINLMRMPFENSAKLFFSTEWLNFLITFLGFYNSKEGIQKPRGQLRRWGWLNDHLPIIISIKSVHDGRGHKPENLSTWFMDGPKVCLPKI